MWWRRCCWCGGVVTILAEDQGPTLRLRTTVQTPTHPAEHTASTRLAYVRTHIAADGRGGTGIQPAESKYRQMAICLSSAGRHRGGRVDSGPSLRHAIRRLMPTLRMLAMSWGETMSMVVLVFCFVSSQN